MAVDDLLDGSGKLIIDLNQLVDSSFESNEFIDFENIKDRIAVDDLCKGDRLK